MESPAESPSTKRGVLLMNLGSPASTEVKDVRKYLKEFLMDERVIDVPWLMRALLVKGIIAPFRAPKSAHAYRSIWWKEGSPLIVLTEHLRDALQAKIQEPVEVVMRYGDPHPREGFQRLMDRVEGLEEVILVPLYPHYAMSSYETAVEYARDVHRQEGYAFRLKVLDPVYQDAWYIRAMADSIRPYLNQEHDYVLFSFHGVPERHILKGDITHSHCLKTESCCETDSPAHSFCYRHQVRETTRLVARELQLPEGRYGQSFQSRLGRDPWLRPYTAEVLQQLPAQGIRNLLVACPAFVSDCLETLEEIALQGKELFLEAGGTSFDMIPCLNTHPSWIAALEHWIAEDRLGHAGSLFR